MISGAKITKISEPKALQPIIQLIEELKSDDLKRRIHSIKNLGSIASALGPERTRSELLPFIMGIFK